MIYLDTHILVWTYSGLWNLLSEHAIKTLDDPSIDLFISPMAKLELEYLFEIGRIKVNAQTVIDGLKQSHGLTICTKNFIKVADIALNEKWTRDPFDRIITAQAKLDNQYLLTKDRKILAQYDLAVWDG